MEKSLQSDPDPEPASDRCWSDKELVDGLINENSAAINHFYNLFGKLFKGWFYSKSSIKDEIFFYDVLHKAMMATLKNLKNGSYKEDGKFKYYFYKIAIQIFYSELRKKKKYKKSKEAVLQQNSTLYIEDDVLILKEETDYEAKKMQALQDLLHNVLTKEERFIVEKRSENVKFKKIAKALNKKEPAIKMQHKRLLIKLRLLLSEKGFQK